MLPAAARMRASKAFGATVRDGVRAGRGTVVVHARRSPETTDQPVQVGFVVSRQVGNAVVRNRVKRRLRHLACAQLDTTPHGVSLVVRALPAAADETNPLAADLAGAWASSLRKLGGRAVKYPLIGFVLAWRKLISPLYGDVCKYYPSCSAYGLDALRLHGALRGAWMIVRRLGRCHPWAHGGFDPVPGSDFAAEMAAHPERFGDSPSHSKHTATPGVLNSEVTS